MIDNAVLWFMAFDFTSRMGMLLYWLPFLMCMIGYFFRTVINFQAACALRDQGKDFRSDTLGHLVGRVVMTCTPVLNLGALVFDLMGSYFSFIGKILDFKLVRVKK